MKAKLDERNTLEYILKKQVSAREIEPIEFRMGPIGERN